MSFEIDELVESNVSFQERRRRRRSYTAREENIHPYRKKPQIQSRKLLALNHAKRSKEPATFKLATKKDLLWIADLITKPEDTPMWVGWNAQ